MSRDSSLSIPSKGLPSASSYLKCPLCDKVFTNSSAIAKHKLTHSEQRKYVCDVCSKAFKRQDHLNGHKLTHQNRKPHACRLCDKSFSDSRSLRRHYENQHSEELHQLQRSKHMGGDVRSVSVASTPAGSYADLEDILNPLFVPKNVFCSVCGKGFKNLAALNGHMRLHGGYTTLSQRRHHFSSISIAISPPPVHSATYLSCSLVSGSPSTNPDPPIQYIHTPSSVSTIHDAQSIPLMHSTSNQETLVELTSSTEVGTSLDLLDGLELQNLDLKTFIENIEEIIESPAPPQLCKEEPCDFFQEQKQSQASWNNTRACHFTFEPAHVNLSQRLSASSAAFPESSNMLAASSYCSNICDTPTVTTPSCPSLGPWDDPAPPPSLSREDTTVVDAEHVDTSLSEGFSSYIFRNPLCRPPFKKSKCKPAPIHIPPQCNAYVSRLRSPRYVGPLSAGPYGVSSTRHHQPPAPPYTPFPMLSPHRRGTGLYCTMRRAHCSTPVTPRLLSVDVFSPHAGITAYPPTQCNAYRSQQCYWASSNIATPSSLSQTSANIFNYDEQALEECRSSLGAASTVSPGGVFSYNTEENPDLVECDDAIITSIHPTINIGSAYQAEIPSLRTNIAEELNDAGEYEVLLWDPVTMITDSDKLKALDLLMKIACSPAIRDCGFNLECAFNLVCKNKGDLDAALRDLLRESFAACDHIYTESSTWTSEEVICFQESIRRHNRNFHQLSRSLQAIGSQKTVKDCVEFYYMWKRMNANRDSQERDALYSTSSIKLAEEPRANVERSNPETRQRSASSNANSTAPSYPSYHCNFEFP